MRSPYLRLYSNDVRRILNASGAGFTRTTKLTIIWIGVSKPIGRLLSLYFEMIRYYEYAH